MPLLENQKPSLTCLLKNPIQNYHIDTNMRTRKLYFLERYNGQFIENSFSKRSVTTWNIFIDDEINLWDILKYKRAKIKLTMTFEYYLRKTHQWQPMVNYFGKTSSSFREKQ